ncbi:NAD-dependent epimerase/dehydratase family protein [Streptomyces gobiensis]|uniref:NAD-dependent epimerase/dehydratase family protein n=1 Tax=Streptomyces gobiensis TaxID=2875706 RepID=UPI00241101DE|nr:NAD-dependent epimerase/dehydratase family protein [Streptomyces gobiensis]UGY93311.1 NAD-dependent epimerase/dehydratase family protein [Streptomyces gobiensis]
MDSAPLPEAPRRALVTGIAGFIASHVSDSLLRQGTQVIGVDRRLPDRGIAAVNLRSSLRHPAFRYLHADLLHHDLAPAVAGADVVFHLAGLPGVRPSWGAAFPDYLDCNVLATQRLMAECERQHVPRLVLASSSSVYGQTGDGPCREDTATRPISPYGITKLAAEQLCLAYARRHTATTSVVALRYFTVYGPRQRTDMLIGRALRAGLSGVPLHIFGDGSNRRDFTYIDDVVTATLAAATAPACAEVINIGGGVGTSVKGLLETVERVATVVVRTIAAPPQPGDMSTTQADTRKARRLLAWRPCVDLTTGVTRQMEWIKRSAGRSGKALCS